MDYDNRAKFIVGGTEYEVAASNGACKLYADEFRGKVDEPYTGSLVGDMVKEFTAEVPENGAAYITWADVPQCLAAVWAMARAAGSTKESYKAFMKKVDAAPVVCDEVASFLVQMFVDQDGLGKRAFFRQAGGQGDAGEPDEADGQE